mgnify:CR=1 FL=1
MKVLNARELGNDMSIAVVAGRFNHFIVDELVSGARDALARQGIDESRQAVVWVPGAFEIPLAADRLAASGKIRCGDCPRRSYPRRHTAF